MKMSYRITKYNKINKKGELMSGDDEWTSFYDIGTKVTEEEYIEIENKYIGYVLAACDCLGVKSLSIKELEAGDDGLQYAEGDIIPVKNVSKVVQSILREYMWCKLVARNCEFHFGYDYYMYFIFDSTADGVECINNIPAGLNVEKYESPYL